jgi:hypothetical protein
LYCEPYSKGGPEFNIINFYMEQPKPGRFIEMFVIYTTDEAIPDY